MDYQKVHEYIWSSVVEGLKYGLDSVPSMKKYAMRELLQDGVITEQEYTALYKRAKCVLCLLYKTDYGCSQCPLFKYDGFGCCGRNSPWQKVIDQYLPLHERVEAATVIRDIRKNLPQE